MAKNFRILKQSLRVSQQTSILEDSSVYTQQGYTTEDILQPSMVGYTEAKSLLLEMMDKGYEDLDIMVALNERFDRQLVDTVLEDCRMKGLF